MENSIDLKLNVKNFSGTLENGKRYRIKSINTFIKSSNSYQLHLFVEDLFEYTYSNDVWMFNGDFSVINYYKKGNYKIALRDSLIELENLMGVQLLKASLKVAV